VRPGTNRTILSLYSPYALKGATVDGKPLQLQAQRELGRNVWMAIIDIPQGGTSTVVVDLTGTAVLAGGAYRFAYLPQVLPNPDSVTVDLEVANAHATGATTSAPVSTGAAVIRGARSVNLKVPRSEGRWDLEVPLRR
jgi:hypothetical protein